MKMGEIRLDQCCRLCLKEGFSLTNIFSHRSAAGDPLYRILNFIYEMKIFENDGLPSQICSPCMWRMIEFNICKRNVRSAEAEIMRLLNRTRTRPDDALNNSLVMKAEDTDMDGASEVVTECDTVHLERLEETYNDSLLAKAEVTEMDGASEVGIYCDTVHSEASVIVGHGKINIKEEIEIVEWEMPEEMRKRAMDVEGQGIRNTMNIDTVSCSSKVILQEKDLELTESELFMEKVDAIQLNGSSDIKNFISLEASEESVRNSFEGESIFSTQGIADKTRDKGMPEDDLRGDVVSEEESAELSNSILDVTESKVFPLKPPLSKRKMGFVCDICKKSFQYKVHLGSHVRIHCDHRPFSCNICDKRFKQNAGRYLCQLRHLRDNMSFENGEKESKKNQYNCGICAKNFSTKRGLYRHSNLHNDKYKCNSCGKCFRSNADLMRHFRIHTKEKPFKCEICLKCFSQKSTMNSHLVIHFSERSFPCDTCDMKFKTKYGKTKHELFHLRK